MTAHKSTQIIPESRLRRLLGPMLDELGKTNRDRLVTILPLFAEGKARLDECLHAAFPGKNSADALKQFTNFRGDINRAADAAGVSAIFQVDSRKRHDPSARECWFESERDRLQDVANFSDEGTRDVGEVAVDNRGLVTNWPAILEGARPVQVFVSYSHRNDKEARELIEHVATRWRAECGTTKAAPSADWLWGDWELRGGQEWEREIIARMQRADVCLFLCSVDSAASHYVNEKELPYFAGAKKPVVPVRLGPGVDLDRMPAVAKFKHLQFVQHSPPKGQPARSYVEVRGHPRNTAEFVARTLGAIGAAVVAARGLGSAPPCVPSKATLPELRREQIEKFSEDLLDDDPTIYPEHSSAHTMNLADLQTLDLAKELPAGKVEKAIDAVERWACDEKSPPFFAVLGEVGIGKTTTLKQFTQRLLAKRQKKNDSAPLPIFVDLRLYTEAGSGRKVPTLDELLAEVIRHHWKAGAGSPTLTPAELVDAVQRDGALIIFDGLDEKIVHYTPEQARQFIRELWRVLPPAPREKEPVVGRRGKMLLSCRSHYFKDVVSQNAMLTGESREGVRAKDYEACIILPFSEDQIRHYLAHALGGAERAEAAILLFSQVHNLSELARRPYLLSLITEHIGELERKAAHGDRVLGVSLYESVVRQWLSRDDGKHQFSTSEKLELMEMLAADMFADGARAWPWDRFERWLGQLLSRRPDIAVRHAAKPAEVLNEDFRTATFVLRPDNSRERFQFAHSSLQEFFHARRLVRALEEKTLDAWAIGLPSLETLDFAGQILALEPKPQMLVSLGELLTRGEPLASRVALRYWLLAVERDYPEPVLDRPAQLAGLDLGKWAIRGRPGRPLLLGGANLANARLDYARFEHVYLADADLSGASCAITEFCDVNLARARLSGTELAGATLHECVAEGLRGKLANWRGAELSRCDLREADLGKTFPREGAFAFSQTSIGNGQQAPVGLTMSLEAIIRRGHSGAVTSCAWSPDGLRLASSGEDHAIRVWEAESGKCLRELVGHTEVVSACAWAPNARRLASAGADKTVRVWEAESGKCLRELTGHTDGVHACAWSPDGRRLASAGEDKTVRVWEAESGKCLRELTGHTDGVHACAWSPDGRRLVSAGRDQIIRVWEAESGKCLRELAGHMNWVNACAWSPDGRRLASAGADRTVRVWEAESGKCLRELAGHTETVIACAWSPDGRRLVSAGDDKTLRVWEAESGECLLELAGHTNWVNACAWSPDSRRLVSASYDKTVRVWAAETGKCLRELAGNTDWATACSWSPDGRQLVSAGRDRTVRVWEAESGRCVCTLAGHEGGLNACAWSTDGRRLGSAGVDWSVRVWDTESGQCLCTLAGHERGVSACAWSPGGRRLASASFDRTVRVWDAESGQCLRTLAGHESRVNACVWSPDGRRLASAGDWTVRVWDTDRGKCLCTLAIHDGEVNACAWSPDGRRLASASADQTLRVWEAESGRCLRTLAGHKSGVNACAWSPDGRLLASASADRTVRVWDAESGQCLRTLAGHESRVNACVWSPDGRRLVTASADGSMRVWGSETGQCELLFVQFRAGETAMLDIVRNRFLWATPGAWRHLGWRVFDPDAEGWTPGTKGRTRILPAEFCGPIPGMSESDPA